MPASCQPPGEPPRTPPPFHLLDPELVTRLDIAGPRYTSYPTVPEWSPEFGADDFAQALARAAEAGPEAPLSLYLHIPFCQEMCLYCGCNVVIGRGAADADRYLDDLEREIELCASSLGGRRRLARVHLGGGTPTFLHEEQLSRLWQMVASRFAIEPGAELAIEVDPVVTRRSQIALLAERGFNRISMGVQDFDPKVQETVHRRQGVDLTRALVEAAREEGFASVNFDLIYGLPHQSEATWRETLNAVVALAPDRIALFSFAYLPLARPHQKKLPAAAIPRGPAKLELFRQAHLSFFEAGYQAIGMDHFARPTDELARAEARGELWRDFQGYTTRRAGETVALGITGISDVGGVFAQTLRSRTRYHEAVAASRFAIERGIRLSDDDRRRRAIITDLMCNFRVDLGPGGELEFASELSALEALERDRLVERAGTQIRVTPLGRLFVRNVAMVFDAYLARTPVGRRPAFSRTV